MAVYYDEDDEREYYEFEPLPTLLEDEENVSLADVLSLRDSCLNEQDIWAACLECCLSMKSITHTPLFHTLCITPDTLAFNANGNVCFMEQLSDDPEGAFVPPEFDDTGNTFEAHIYSLGATLTAAAEYVIEPELELDLSQELRNLLDQMQQEKPEDRPDIERILSKCEEKTKRSSDIICRNLSAIGRRVLSIESVSALPDGCEYTWKVKKRQAGVGYEVQTSERNPADGSSSTEDLACDRSILNDGTAEVIYRAENYDYDVDKNSTEVEVNEIFQQGLEYPSSAEICDRKKTELGNDPAETVLDLKNNGSNVSMDLSSAQKRPVIKKRILPKLPTEMEDRPQYFYPKSGILVTPNPSPLSLSLYFDSAQEFLSLQDAASIRNPVEWPQKLQFRTKNNAVSFVENNSLASIKLNIPDIEAVSKSSCIPTLGRFRELSPTSPSISGSMSWNKNLKNEVSTMHKSQMGSPTSNGILFKEGPVFGNGRRNSLGAEENYFHCIHNNVPVEERVTGGHHRCDFKQRRCTSVSDLSTGNIKLFGNMTQHNQEDEPRTPLDSTENNCANFTNDRQYFSLQDILSMDDKTLKDHELWSLCHECLTSLQLGKDYPAYLCLESVYIDCNGKVLFITNPSKGTFDSFYLAPEFEKQSIVTEKVCVYGVAAILWTAAKFNAPANEKLSLSKSLKKLLLSMAKRNSAERPSVKEVLKICNDYLVHRGIVSRKILTLLRNTVLQNQHKEDAFVSEMEFQTEEIKPFHSPLGNIDCTQESARLGFVPLAGDSKLTAVKGPIPCQYSVNSKSPSKLPEAFTSPATHFKPIILTQHKEKTSTKMPAKTSTAKQLVKAMKHEIQKNKEMVSVKDIENDIVMEKSTTDFGTESLENNPNGSIHLVSSGQIVSPSDVSHTIEGKKDNISTTLSQAQKANSSFYCSAVSTFTANNNILHQNSKSRMRTSTPIQLEIPEQDVSSEDKIKSYFPEPALLLNKESDRHSGDSFKFVTFPLQDTSTHMIGSNEDLKATNKRFPGSDPSNDAFNGSVDTEDVASQSPLSNKCLFTQETLGTGIQAKTFAPIPHFTDISDDVHMPSSHILSCSLEPHMAIKSSSSDPICLLQKIVHLIQEEFAFDGYLENGEEARAMGEYILSLNRLKFGTFTNAVSEKFCDLYWDEKLLEQLYEVVNGDPPPLSQFAVWSNTGCSGLTLPKMNKKNTQLPIHGTERSKDIQENNLLVAEEKIADIDDTLSDHLYSVTGEEDQLHNNTEVIPGHDVNSIISDAMDFKETAPDISKEEGTLFQIASKQPVEACTISENLTERYNEEKEETDSYTTEVLEARVSVALCPTLSTVEKKSCNPGWSSAFFGMECFNQDVKTYVKQLGQHNSSETQNIEAKMLELDQQLMMEMKDFRKTKTFYQKLQQQERRNKGTDTKIVLPKLKEQLEEVKLKVEFLELAKKYLEVLHMELWGLNSSVLPSLVSSSSQIDMLELKSADLNSLLTFHSLKEDQSQSKIRLQLLQAGTTVGLMAYLYNSNAVIEGYVQQFFYTFRYFISPSDFFQFLNDRFDSAAHISLNQKRSTDCIKVLNRTLDLLQAWVEECYNVDFAQDIELLHKLETFISTKAIPYGDRGQHLVNLLHNCSEDKMVRKLSRLSFSAEDMKIEEDIQSFHSFSKKLSEENISRKSFKWKISKGSESTSPQHKERYYSIAAALPRPCYSSFAAELSGSSQKLDEKGLSMLTENSPQHTAQQLTLLQQELFQDCHPVHFLNSRALGVNDKSSTVTKSVSPEPMVIEGNSLFVPEYRQDQYLIQLIKYAENVGNWVSAEIVNCDTSKTQSGLITKCLLMAKCCYEWRNFATAMQILSGLENLIVRQLPTWKNLPSKALEIMEELTAVQVFLKSDSLCLMEGDSFRKQPTIPCACILAMHAQQVEIGAFTMANGTYKWPKLRKIAKVVSQIRAFQENPYVFAPDSEMQMYLRQRISHFSEVDIHVLAAENKTNFYQPSNEMHSRKIQDTLRKVKATFQ